MNQHDPIRLLHELIAIPSVNPDHDPDETIHGECRMVMFLEGLLAELGFDLRRFEVYPGRENLLAEFGPAQARKTILFEAHLDTVGVAGMTRAPFKAVQENGRLYGRGACDMKGALAAFLAALDDAVLDRLQKNGVRLAFAGAVGEETGNQGAIHLARQGLQFDEAVILEPTGLHVVHAHKGAYWFQVTAKGKAAHGSCPELGVNAILGMRQVMDLLEGSIQEDRARHAHPVLGPPTLSIGMIKGGTAVNIVPEACVINVDRRMVPGECEQEIQARLTGALAQLQADGVLVGFEFETIKHSAPFETPAQAPLIRRFERVLRQGGVEPRIEGAGWYSDAGPLSACCREVAIFGPGHIAQAHTADEYIEVSELQKGCALLRQLLWETAVDS